MSNLRTDLRHPIRVVASRTGLSVDVIRVWERRYGVVHPARGEGGQRGYSDADIERLTLLRRVTEAGRAISQVAGLPDDVLRQLVAQDSAVARDGRHDSPSGRSQEQAHHATIRDALDAVAQLDTARLDDLLRAATLELGTRQFIGGVLAPLLQQIGDRWRSGHITEAHEHAATSVIQGLVHWLAVPSKARPGAATIVVATPQDERHELGAMLVAASARLAGWRVAYLGPDLPVDAIAAAAGAARATCVALSVVYPTALERLLSDFPRLRQTLGRDVAVMIGGAAAIGRREALEALGARVVDDLHAFEAALDSTDIAPAAT